MGRSNWRRCLAYSTLRSIISLAPPTAPAARDTRPSFRISMAYLKPRPGSPSRLSFGTGTFLRYRSVVDDPFRPSLSSSLPVETPGRSRVTTKALIVSSPRRSVRAKTVNRPACPPLVMKRLPPFRFQTWRVSSHTARADDGGDGGAVVADLLHQPAVGGYRQAAAAVLLRDRQAEDAQLLELAHL